MNELLKQANKTLDDVCTKQMAHWVSYVHHYKRDLWIGGAANVVSAIVGAGVFTVLVSQLGLDGKKVPQGVPSGYTWLYWVVLLLCVAAPALTAVAIVRHDAKDAEDHLRSSDSYVELKGQLEDFLRQYAVSDSMGGTNQMKRKEAEDEYKRIREKVNSASRIGLMPEAELKAKRLLAKKNGS